MGLARAPASSIPFALQGSRDRREWFGELPVDDVF
jgi:hypothetical protein